MKRCLIRSIALVLLVVMLAPAVPLKAKAHQYIPIYWTEEVYTRDGLGAYIYELETVQKNCYGFNLDFEITSITKGNLKGDFNLEVCVHDTSGNWFVAEMFWLNETGKTIDVNVCWKDARDIDKFTIIPRKKNLEWYQRVSIRNPKYERAWYPWGIEYTYSDKKFEKSGKWTYPVVFEKTLRNCRGFTLSYEIDEITKGTLTPATKYDVYARESGGKWKKIHTFSMYNDEAIVDIGFYYEKDVMDIDEVAVLCTEKKQFSYVANLAFSDVYYDAEEEEEAAESGSEYGYLPGYWSDTPFNRSGRNSIPFVFDTPLKKCKGFTLDYEVHDVTEGNMKDNCKFQIFYRTSDGTWNKSKEFTVEDGFASVNVKLKKAATVTQVAVHCMNAGYFSFQYSMGVRDPVF